MQPAAAVGEVTRAPLPTLADLEGYPEGINVEIIDGEIIRSPRPAPRHSSAASDLVAQLRLAYGRRRGNPGEWLILIEPELHLPTDRRYLAVIPDLAGWLRETLAELPETASFDLRPDWVCEVVSPTSVRRDRVKKMDFYRRAGVRWLWLVDPLAETLEAYASEGERWMLLGTFGEDDRVRVAPFDATEIELSPLWDRPSPEPPVDPG